MKRTLNALSLISIMSLGLSACSSDAPEASSERPELRDGMGAFALRASFGNNTPVRNVKYIITRLSDGKIHEEVVPLNHNLAIPGGVPELERFPFDEDSKHRFTDLFHHVEPGQYAVRVEPLDAAGLPIDECYGAATLDAEPMVAVEGKMTEKILVIQCHSQDPSALNIIAAINHEPEGLTITWEKETDDTHSKFTCDGEHIVCLTAHDVDNDPLRFELNLPDPVKARGCRAEPIAPFAVTPPKIPCTDVKQCFRVTCDNAPKKLDLQARVYDQAWLNNSLVDIEQWLKTQQKSDAPIESHTKFDFWGYFLTEEDDRCRPCEDCQPPDTAPFSYVILQDASESMEDALPQIRSDVNRFAFGIASNLKAKLDAFTPPNVTFNVIPNGGVASFIDKPVAPLGTVADYVYKLVLPTRSTQDGFVATTPAQVRDAFNSISTIKGADSSEAQLQALLAMLGNYDQDKFYVPNGAPSLWNPAVVSTNPWNGSPTNDFYLPFPSRTGNKYVSIAIVITSSPFHAKPDCKDAGKCNEDNNHSPMMKTKEDYPEMQKVAEALKARNVHPIFLVTEEQGGFATAAYTQLANETGGIVKEYVPGSTDIEEIVSNFVFTLATS